MAHVCYGACSRMADFDEEAWHPAQRRGRAVLALAAVGLGICCWYAWTEYEKHAKEEGVSEIKGDLGETGSAPRPPPPGAVAGWGLDLTIVIEDEEKAGAANFDAGTFEAGTRVGHAYVYDYDAGAVVCAGLFVAGSSKQLEVSRERPRDSFETVAGVDLDINSAKAAIASLRDVRRAAPPR